MKIFAEDIAHAVGASLLKKAGGELLELVYLLGEDGALEALRALSYLTASDRMTIRNFAKLAEGRDDLEMRLVGDSVVLGYARFEPSFAHSLDQAAS